MAKCPSSRQANESHICLSLKYFAGKTKKDNPKKIE